MQQPTGESIAWLEGFVQQDEPPAVNFAVLVMRGFVALEDIASLQSAGLEFFEVDDAAWVFADEFVRAVAKLNAQATKKPEMLN